MTAEKEDMSDTVARADFSHLSKLNPSGKTALYTFHRINGTPVLEVKSSSEDNKPYYNAVLKRAHKNQSALAARTVSAGLIDESRAEDRILYCDFVVVGWPKPPRDATGREVPFSKAECGNFLNSLPNWIFDGLRDFAALPVNFLQDDDGFEGAEDAPKNLQTVSSGNSD